VLLNKVEPFRIYHWITRRLLLTWQIQAKTILTQVMLKR